MRVGTSKCYEFCRSILSSLNYKYFFAIKITGLRQFQMQSITVYWHWNLQLCNVCLDSLRPSHNRNILVTLKIEYHSFFTARIRKILEVYFAFSCKKPTFVYEHNNCGTPYLLWYILRQLIWKLGLGKGYIICTIFYFHTNN